MARPITGHCGAHQMQAILGALGHEAEVNDLYVSRIHRDGFGTGISWDKTYTMPWDIPRVLGRYGIKATTHFTRGARLLPLALACFARKHPLIIDIRSTKDGGLHWVSVWDYDPERDVFLTYDSQYEDKDGGIGNVEFSPAFLQSRLPFGVLWAIEPHI